MPGNITIDNNVIYFINLLTIIIITWTILTRITLKYHHAIHFKAVVVLKRTHVYFVVVGYSIGINKA